MSLFDEAEKARNPFGTRMETASKTTKVSYINQTSVFLRVLAEVVESRKLPAAKAKEVESYRTRLGDCHWGLHLLQGKVSEDGWPRIVSSAIDGMLKTIKNSQPNGTWEIIDHDVKIEKNEHNIEQLFFVVKFVDIENAPELAYQNGVPVTTTVNVTNSPIPEEVIEALSSKNTDDSELKDMIRQLVGALAANATSQVAVQAEPPKPVEAAEPEPVVFSD
tara:strand:+ start:257 stop:916 length:660 start_codon:yes stop_codon:yes gene_type:complete